MSTNGKPETRMDRLHKAAQIFALVLTPIAVGAVGWAAQWSVSHQGVRKDLIQVSLQVLKEPRRPETEALRQWARETINRNSDVRLTEEAADQLSNSAAVMLKTSPFLMSAMEPRLRCPKVDLKAIPTAELQAIEELQAQCERNWQDLFWMQTFGRLLRDYRPGGAASAPR